MGGNKGSGSRPVIFRIQVVLCLLAVGMVLLPLFLDRSPWPVKLRDYLEAGGVEETGAVNIVSSIYLGYRAYDTLGETMVLLVAVSGTIGMIVSAGKKQVPGAAEEAPEGPRRKEHPHFSRRRTVLMEVVAGKLGPVVLVFGLYVMLFGHMSPGGGFQGGVVIASGIIFISLGTRGEYGNLLARGEILSAIEAVSFLLLVISSGVGIFAGLGYFANPFRGGLVPPLAFIILLNTMIGLKVGSGIAYLSVSMMGDVEL